MGKSLSKASESSRIEGWEGLMRESRQSEIKEENRKICFLRFLVDLSLQSVQEDALSLEEALKVVEDVKRAACHLFPGKGETFELIYRPRFNRVIQERFPGISFIS